MPRSLLQTLVLVLLMALGFLAGKRRVLEAGTVRGLSRFLVNYVLPCLVIASMQRPFSPALRDEAFRVLLLSFAVYAAAFPLAFLFARAIGARGATGGVIAFVGVFSNVAFMGFPVMEALFGKDILFAVSIYNIPFQLLAFSVGAVMIARGTGGEREARGGAEGEAGRRLPRLGVASFLTPAGISSFVGFGLFLGGVSLEGPLLSAMRLMGDTTTPLSMALIGAVLARGDLRASLGNPKVWLASAYRLLALPLILWLVLRLAGFSGRELAMPVVIAAMPAAANSTILAEAYGGDSATASSLVFVSTALSIATIPFLAAALFGL